SPTIALLIIGVLFTALIVLIFYLRKIKSEEVIGHNKLQKAYEKLNSSEKVMSLIYENANDFIALYQLVEGKYIIQQLPESYLQSLEKHTGYTKKDIIGEPISFLYNDVLNLTSDEKALRYENLKYVVENCKTYKYEEDYKRPNGTRGLAKSMLIPMADQGKCRHVLYVSRDITAERDAELRLERAVKMFQSLVENNPAAILLFNSNGKIEMVNSKFNEYFGYHGEEIIGQDATIIVPKEHYPTLFEVRKELNTRPRVYYFGRDRKLTALRKDGSTFSCELMLAPTYVEDTLYVIATMLDVTFYREAQAKMQESKEQLESLIDNMPGMVYRVSSEPPFGVHFVSEKSNEVLGHSPKVIDEKNLVPIDVIDDEFHQEMWVKSRAALETGEGQELIVRTKGKDKRWLIDRFKPVTLSTGEVVFDGILIDITDREENRERLKTAIDGARQGMWDWQIPTHEVVVNAYQASMIGFGLQEVGTSFDWWAARVHPDDRERIYELMIAHIKGETEFFEVEYRLKTKLNTFKWIMVRGQVIDRDKEGKALRAMGVHLDINERKKMEIALVKSRARLQALISNLPGMVYRSFYEDGFAMSFVSEGAKQLTGYLPREFTSGKLSLFKLIKPSYHDYVKEEVSKALAENRPYNLIYEIETPSGVKWLFDKGQELEKGQLEGIITDITERVEAEERIIQTIIETEDRERKRIASELHDNLGQKLTTASLNFNALKSQLNDEELLDRVSKGLTHLTNAIKDARDISHNLMPRSIEDFGFALSVESLITELNRISETKFEFYHNLNEKNLKDSVGLHLYRITQEAINNTLKYANAKTVTLQVMAYDDVIIWSIEDDGKGFNKEEVMQNHHFGLDSMKHRVQILSGNIEINSQEGRGTNLTIEIPAKKHYFNEQD
ncbi:PAS domain S-box protein, partial [Fulvivirga sp. RKSG066]|uniref:sensor histidine kinase n=1 Tax=Fulvivirga aurantia TaxID=2529383 RepID=UPI001CA3CB11